MMDFLYQSIKDLLDWFFGKPSEVPTTQSPPEVQEKQQQVHLDREAVDTIAKEVARRVGELSSKNEVQVAQPAAKQNKKTIKIRTGYVPNLSAPKGNGEDIQANLGSIKAKEEESSGVEDSLKALRKLSERREADS
ncbi:MAG: hypothetical protein GY800_11165 [Planctomycetes bacterium]|nr:hypothetical protein [Planctomycetota bacterium]